MILYFIIILFEMIGALADSHIKFLVLLSEIVYLISLIIIPDLTLKFYYINLHLIFCISGYRKKSLRRFKFIANPPLSWRIHRITIDFGGHFLGLDS